MTNLIGSDFIDKVDPSGRLRVSACYQCGKCSSGCPMFFDTDLLPHQLIRLIQMDAKDEVLSSRHVWACASCGTCVSRCPMGVRTPEVIDALRGMSRSQGKPTDNRSPIFNDAFLASVRKYGRVFEPGMLMAYKLRSKDFFGDMDKGRAMFKKGKLKLIPPKGADKEDVRRIFLKVMEKK